MSPFMGSRASGNWLGVMEAYACDVGVAVTAKPSRLAGLDGATEPAEPRRSSSPGGWPW